MPPVTVVMTQNQQQNTLFEAPLHKRVASCGFHLELFHWKYFPGCLWDFFCSNTVGIFLGAKREADALLAQL